MAIQSSGYGKGRSNSEAKGGQPVPQSDSSAGSSSDASNAPTRQTMVPSIAATLFVQDKATKKIVPLKYDATAGITVTLAPGTFNDSEGDPANVATTALDGSSVYAARRDHVHTIAAATVTGTMIANLTITGANIAAATIDVSTKTTGILPTLNGGTGAPLTPAVGDMLYATSGTTFARLADVAVGSYLRSGGVTTAPLWSTLTLPNAATTGDVLYATGTNAIGNLADVAAGSYLRSGGVGTAPIWSTPTLPNAAGTALKWLRSDGTNFITSTATLAEGAVTSGKILVSDGTNWIASTPTFPNASSAAGTMIRSDATNWVATSAPTTTDSNADNIIGASGTTKKVMVVQAKASQTANVFETQDSTGAVTANVTPLGWSQDPLAKKRVTTQVDAVGSTTLVNSGLSWTLAAGRTYNFRLVFITTAAGAGGVKFDLNGGSATVTTLTYSGTLYVNGVAPAGGNATTLANTIAATAAVYETTFDGTITVNAGGTFIPRFAQNVASGTSSLLVGSYGWLEDVP